MSKKAGRPPLPEGVKKVQVKFWLTQECRAKIKKAGGQVTIAPFIEEHMEKRQSK